MDCLAPLAVVFEHLLQRPVLGNCEASDEKTLVGAYSLDLSNCLPGIPRVGRPVVERLVEFGDAGVFDLRALFAESVDDGG